jgi:hypothetical protein
MADPISMCSSADCPIAATCRRHEASGTVSSGRRQSWTTYHWRRHRISERVICNGFEEAASREEVAHG